MIDQFNFYSEYYNLLNQDKDYDLEIKYIIDLLSKYGKSIETILEFGSGTGLHGSILQKKGYSIQGIEISPKMVRQALDLGYKCHLGDITEFSTGETYDSVISLFHVVSYMNTNQQLIAVFNNARSHLKDGGLFIFDAWYSPAVLSKLPEVREKKIENNLYQLRRHANPTIYWNKNVIDVKYRIVVTDKISGKQKEILETHSMRHFSLPEIELISSLTGFELIQAEEFCTGNKPSNETWGVCFVLKKM